MEEKFEFIAAGEGIALTPLSVAQACPRPGLAYVPVRDAEPIPTCLALAKGQRQRRVLDFVTVATRILRQPPRLLATS